jgi:16S rRNA G966 N2-methylase RsmD
MNPFKTIVDEGKRQFKILNKNKNFIKVKNNIKNLPKNTVLREIKRVKQAKSNNLWTPRKSDKFTDF